MSHLPSCLAPSHLRTGLDLNEADRGFIFIVRPGAALKLGLGILPVNDMLHFLDNDDKGNAMSIAKCQIFPQLKITMPDRALTW